MSKGCLMALASVLILLPELAGQAQKPKREFQLEGKSEELWRLIDRNAKLGTLASGFGFTEGPIWDPKGFVYVSDEETNKIVRV